MFLNMFSPTHPKYGRAPKIVPLLLLCWPVTSEVDVGGMAVEVEASLQYSTTVCCCVADGSRGAA